MEALLAVCAALLLVLMISYAAAAVALNGGKHIPMTVRPETFGLSYDPVEFRSDDGIELNGWFVPAQRPSGRTIIFCHGWGANKGEVLKNTAFLQRQGFNLFYFDFRCCGESSGTMLSVGALEARDLDAAVSFVKSRRPGDTLAIYGVSMGSMVAFAGLTRHPELRAAVLECPFSSHNQALARYAWAKFSLPYYPFMPLVFFFVRQRLGFDPEAASPERLAAGLKAIPILAVCGENDPIAIPAIGRSLIAKLSAAGELWVVPGAGHAKCAETAGRAYEEKLGGFFSSHVS
ncbi:MAG: alpha/beta fold hydrolase [Elusimicrobia bacterium]|nr:alpha/beta fold hydrolase [Elusimicrobiota bacterium]